MERKNSKQLRLDAEVGELAEQVHRDYQSYNRTSISFCAFGNLIMREGLDMAILQMKVKKKYRNRRKING
ncbi:hypothetical protein LCGC14_2066690 [marine sediment metagenome]|uniref:Uncharacterized protein n=1 Tax=marine sediment metagenome TaxID=412755 RepID=A0A0F9F716_9ZZZZ